MTTVDPAVGAALRAALALLFAWAGAHKLRDAPAFRGALQAYRLVPDALAMPLAVALAVVELVAAAALLAPAAPRWVGPAAAIALLATYTAAIAVNLARGRRDIDCGCAGPARRQPLGAGLVLRNGALLLAAATCLLPASSRPLVWLDAVTVTAAVAAAAAVYDTVDRLLTNAPRLARLRVT